MKKIIGVALLCGMQMYAGDCEQQLKLHAEIKQLEHRIETAAAQFALTRPFYQRMVCIGAPTYEMRDLSYGELRLAYWAYACKEIKEGRRDLYSILDIANMASTEQCRVDTDAVGSQSSVVCAECKNDWQIICNRILTK